MNKKRKKVTKVTKVTKTCEEEPYEMPKELDTQGCINLIEAMVKQARYDVLHSKPGSVVRRDAEKFIASQYFTGLTGLEGKPLVQMLQAEYEEKQAKKKGARKS